VIWALFLNSKLVQGLSALALTIAGILTFGAVKKRAGKEEAYDEMQEQDRAEADAIRHRVRNAGRVSDDDIEYRD
jgi:hypothetical protein